MRRSSGVCLVTTRALLGAALASALGACVSARADRDVSRAREEIRERLGGATAVREMAPSPGTSTTSIALEEPLDADRAVAVALARSPAIRAALDTLGVRRASLVGEALVANPRVEAEVRFREEGRDPALELALTQNLTDVLTLSGRGDARDAEVEAARLAAVDAVLDLALSVRVAFLGHQADLQRLELARTVLDSAEASLSAAQALHEAGNLNDLALVEQQDLLEQSKIAASEAELQVARSRARVTHLLAVGDAPWTATPRLADPSADALDLGAIERAAVERSLELEGLKSRIRAAASRAHVAAVRGLLPDLELGVAAHTEEPGAWEVGPRLELGLPFFDHGQATVAGAEAEQSRLESLSAEVEIRVRAGARIAAESVNQLGARARKYHDVVLPLRRRLVEETAAQVNAMNMNLFQLLSAKRAEVEAARAYVSALEQYWVARADLDQITRGGRPREGEATPDAATTSREEAEGGHRW